MAQPPEPTTTSVPALSRPQQYLATLPPGFVFQPKGRCLVDRYLLPRALHGRVPDNAVQDGIAEGVDVCAVRPEALPFPSRCRGRGQFDGRAAAWGYFFTTRPAAAAGGHGVAGGDGDDVQDVAAGGCWRQYGREKAYFGDDGGVIAFRTRFAFHEAADGRSRKTAWRMKEFRLNESAARFRGVTFHPSAKDLVIWKVYNEVEIPEEEPLAEYYSSSSDDDGYKNKAKRFKVGDAIAGPAANAA